MVTDRRLDEVVAVGGGMDFALARTEDVKSDAETVKNRADLTEGTGNNTLQNCSGTGDAVEGSGDHFVDAFRLDFSFFAENIDCGAEARGLLLQRLADFDSGLADFDSVLADGYGVLRGDFELGADFVEKAPRGRHGGDHVFFGNAGDFVQASERFPEREQHGQQNKRLQKHAKRRDGGKCDVNPLRNLVHAIPRS
jgi:hypothetical protein